MSIDERAEEKRALREAQSLPLNPDGSLNIAGFHLRDAAHRRLAVELLREIVIALLPSSEVVAKRRQDAETQLNNSNNNHNNSHNSTSSGGAGGAATAAGDEDTSTPNTSVHDNASFGNCSFGETSGSVSPSSAGFGRKSSSSSVSDLMHTRTRTVKLSSVSQHCESAEAAAEQLRPFISQLLVYPDCADEILRSLGDLFIKFVRACATSSDVSATVVMFVRWLSALTMRFTMSECLTACDALLELQRLARRMKKSALVQPVEIARIILGDITRHLEDESTWYPAARICLCRLYLNAPPASTLPTLLPPEVGNASLGLGATTPTTTTINNGSQNLAASLVTPIHELVPNYPNSNNNNNNNINNNNSSSVVDDDKNATPPPSSRPTTANSGGAPMGTPHPKQNDEETQQEYDEGDPYAVANMVTGDSSLLVRIAAICELTRWLNNSPADANIVERAAQCIGAVNDLYGQGTGSSNPSSPNDLTGATDLSAAASAAASFTTSITTSNNNNDSMWSQSDALRYSCIPLVLAVCEKVQFSGRQNNASGLHLLQESASFALRFASDSSWRVRFRLASVADRFVAFPGCNAQRWVATAQKLARDEEPAIRGSIAARASEIFMHQQQSQTTSSASSSSPSSSPSPDPALALPVMLLLARDTDADVRCAVVTSFFSAWSSLSKKMNDSGSSRSCISCSSSSSSSSTSNNSKSEDQQLAQQCASVFHNLLFDTAEKVRVAALGSLNELGELFVREPTVLSEAVQAVVVAVRTSGKSYRLGSGDDDDDKMDAAAAGSNSNSLMARGGGLAGFSAAAGGAMAWMGAPDAPLDDNGESGSAASLLGAFTNAAALLNDNGATNGDEHGGDEFNDAAGGMAAMAALMKSNKMREEATAAVPARVFSAQSAGTWQIRKLGAEQLPLLARHMPLSDFKKELWSCLSRLLCDPTAAVRDHVMHFVLPSVATTYGAACALSAMQEFVVPLLAHKRYKERRCGFLALAATTKVVLIGDQKQNEADDDSIRAVKEQLRKLVRETVEQSKNDAVSLVREAVATELSRNIVLSQICV